MTDTDSKTGKEYLGLTPRQRKLLYGEIAFERSDQLVKIINDKACRLPKRLDNILTDIDALSEAGLFESNWEPPVSETIKENCQEEWQSYEWESVLREILDDDGIAGMVSDNVMSELPPSPDGEIRQFNKNARAKNFGNSLGIAIYQLTQNCMSQERRTNILIGFIDGFLFGKDGPQNYNQGEQTISTVLEDIDEIDWQHKLKIRTFSTLKPPAHRKKKENIKLAEQVINQTNLSETKFLSEYIIDNAFDIDSIQDHRTISVVAEESQSGDTDNKDLLPEYKNRSIEKRKLLRGEVIAELVKRNTNIERAEQLILNVEITMMFLQKRDELQELFEKLYTAHNNPKKKSVNSLISNPKKNLGDDWGSNKGRVRTLHGEKVPLEGIELLSKNSSGDWKMTPLGKLVGYIHIEQDNRRTIDELCHKFVLGGEITDREEQLIDDAISTFDSKNST
jgi:hypothetical protein